MRLPLEVKARNMTLDPALLEEIRERADRLDRFYPRVIRCRVTVEGPGPHHHHGIHRASVTLTVPGSILAITHQSGADPAGAVREAFSAAGRRLEDFVRRIRGFVKTHAVPVQETG